jgi:hypothetical protein
MRLRLLGCNGRSSHVNPLIRVRVNAIREPIACISDRIDQPKGLTCCTSLPSLRSQSPRADTRRSAPCRTERYAECHAALKSRKMVFVVRMLHPNRGIHGVFVLKSRTEWMDSRVDSPVQRCSLRGVWVALLRASLCIAAAQADSHAISH